MILYAPFQLDRLSHLTHLFKLKQGVKKFLFYVVDVENRFVIIMSLLVVHFFVSLNI